MKRFYFDDGKSQKAWQIEQQGRKQTVRFGRLGSMLRQSVKAFASPKLAAQETEKLIASKRKGGYVEIDASKLEIRRPRGSKSATAKGIQTLEESLGHKLPKEYQQFLLSTNGGEPRPGFIQIIGVPHIENVGVDTLYGLQTGRTSLEAAIARYGAVLPKGHLPIASGNDVFTLCLKGKHYGSVVFWDHETDTLENDEKFVESDGHRIAGSFDEFLTRIALFYEEDSGAQVAANVSKKGAGKPSWRRLFSLLNRDLEPDADPKHVASEIDAQGGDLSSIGDGELPFQNIRNPKVLRLLLAAKLDPSLLDREGHPLIWLAANCATCVAMVVKAGGDIEQRASDGETALVRAIFVGNKRAVRKLLSLGANPTVRIPMYVNTGLKYDKPISRLMDEARSTWTK